jgi:hypothetical protein
LRNSLRWNGWPHSCRGPLVSAEAWASGRAGCAVTARVWMFVLQTTHGVDRTVTESESDPKVAGEPVLGDTVEDRSQIEGARAPASRTRTGGPASVFSKRGKLKKPVGQQEQTSFWMICAIVSGVSSASLRRCSRCGQRSMARFYQQDCRGSRVLIGRW